MNVTELLEPILFIIGLALCVASSLFVRDLPDKKVEGDKKYDLD